MAAVSAAMDGMHLDGQNIQAPTQQAGWAKYAEDEPGDTLPFYEVEGKILALWDQLNELKTELAIAETVGPENLGLPCPAIHKTHKVDKVAAIELSDEEAMKQLEKAEKELLEARAEHMLRQSVVGDTIIAVPTLNAVHAGSNATGTERSVRYNGLETALTP